MKLADGRIGGDLLKKFLKEFREFALRGNVMNLAVGVMIGAAFQGMVTSLTDNILAPFVELFIRSDFEGVQVRFGWISLGIGAFISSVINFFIMAFVVFLLMRGMNRLLAMGEKKPEEKTEKRKCPYCFSEIHQEATRCPACTSVLESEGNA